MAQSGMMENMTDVRERTVATNGVDLHVVEAGEGPLVVLAHGFPELAYSWRHQVPAIAAAGYRVIAPDQRGYGRSSRPEVLEDYDIEHLVGDLLGLLDEAGEERAIFVGHDWGSLIVSSLVLLAPERVNAIVNMSVPFIPRAPMPPVEMMRMAFADAFFYIVYFQEPGVADANLGDDAATTMRRMLTGVSIREGEAPDPANFANDGRGFIERMPEPERLPDWLDQSELDHYIEEFSRTGFTGGLNWYRNLDRNWSLTERVADKSVEVPSLFIGGRLDPVIAMTPPDSTVHLLGDHRGTVLVDGAGHWVQQEKPDEVNDALIGFLDELKPA
jgi:pimeloyl-ACP methyl ester carboxylesterase